MYHIMETLKATEDTDKYRTHADAYTEMSVFVKSGYR